MHWLGQNLRTVLFHLSDAPVTPLSLLLFLATLIATVIIARLVRRGVRHFFERKGEEHEGIAYAIGRIVQYVIYAVGFVFALDNVGIDLAAFAAVGAVITVGVGFGMQNIASNFISGIILLIERPVQKGDFIAVGDTVGTVTAIEMRATKVVSPDGVAIIVPNSELISSYVLNQSSPTTRRRVTVSVGVAYGSDAAVVRDTLIDVAKKNENVLADPEPKVFFKDFGDSALAFDLTVWIARPEIAPAITSDLRFAIDAAFRVRGIEIPFPQRDLHLRSGFEKIARAT
jgi:small-conductance mechanosensitive channel